MFGGNSNWRGPDLVPDQYPAGPGSAQAARLLRRRLPRRVSDRLGTQLPLDQIADDLSRRLISIFLRDADGRRPVFGGTEVMQTDPHWRDHILFYEYFHGDNGAGIGASHQTGWTAIVANLHRPVTDAAVQTCRSRQSSADRAIGAVARAHRSETPIARTRRRHDADARVRTPRARPLTPSILERPHVAFGREICGDLEAGCGGSGWSPTGSAATRPPRSPAC